VDIGVKEVKKYFVTDKATKEGAAFLERYGVTDPNSVDAVFVVEEGSEEYNEEMKGRSPLENAPRLNEYIMDNFTPAERAKLKEPKFFYQITFDKPGGLVMPIIVEYTFADGTTEIVRYPVQVWRKNDAEVSKAVATDKEIIKVVVDPFLETADVNLENNSWPREEKEDKFEQFRNQSGD